MECADSESAYILNDASPLQTTAAEDTEKRVQSNIPLTGVNLVLAITGPGVIGVPYALREAGFGLGIVLLVLVAAITDYSVLMLVEVGSLTGLTSYQDVMFSVFGKPGFCLLTFLQFTYPFIALVGSNVMIGDTITKLVGRVGGESLAGTVLSNRQFIILLVTLFITLPISLYKNIARLSKWSCLSIGLLAVLAVFFLIRIPEFADSLPTTSETFTFARGNVTQATGIIACTFMCHHNVFLIHQSLENNTSRRWKIVTHSSFIVSLVIMLVIGVTGYVTFKQEAQGDLLENYCHEDDLINTGRFCLALIVMLSYPIECFATREVLGLSLFANLKDSTSRHVIITVCITALATAVSFSTDCLGIVIELNGVMTACPLTFIIPPLLLIRLRGPPYISWRNVVPALLFLFGVLLGVGGTGIAVINIVLKRRRCNHGYEPSYCLSASMQNLTSGAFSA